MSKLPFEKELKEACAKPTLTQRETALIELVGKLQNVLVYSNWDKLIAGQELEYAEERLSSIVLENVYLNEEIYSLEREIEDLEGQIYDLENELESSEETVAELTEEVDTLSERIEELEEIVESLED